MTGPPCDSDDTGGGEGGGSPWTQRVQIPQRQPGGQLLNGRQLHTIYTFATWENMSWRARSGGHLFTVRGLKSQEDCLGPGGQKNR